MKLSILLLALAVLPIADGRAPAARAMGQGSYAVIQAGVPARAEQRRVGLLVYTGMCDASAAAAISPTMFAVANDEDNVLRAYRSDIAGVPLQSFDINGFFRDNQRRREADIEGATRVGNTIYWITSHGTNSSGEERTIRRQFFATDVSVSGASVTLRQAGQTYDRLLDDLINAPELSRFNFREAAGRRPEACGGLNIEGLSVAPDNTLWIAFRNPLVYANPHSRALLLRWRNPARVTQGERATFGEAVELDLDGLGVRSIEYWPQRRIYLILAGSFDDRSNPAIYQWTGNAADKPQRLPGIDLSGLNPEALIIYPELNDRFQILSDDGDVRVNGTRCKDLPELQRSYRGLWINFPPRS